MLLHSKMASIPSSPRHSISYVKNIEHLFTRQTQNSRLTFQGQSTPSGLKYFNMRVTQRLHRYRSMKKQWQEVAISVQNTSLSPTSESPTLQDTNKNIPIETQKSTCDAKPYCINDYINSTTTTTIKDYNEKNTIDLDPLHSRIQQDLIKLRKFIKTKQKKVIQIPFYKTPSSSNRPSGETTSISTALDDRENRHITVIRKASSISKLKPLDRVKIAGCQMRPTILSKSNSADSGVGSTSNASSTCSQYSKQQKLKRHTNNKTFNIYHSRINPPPPPLPYDSFFYRSSYSSRKKLNISSRISQNTPSKQHLPSRVVLPLASILEKNQSTFTKQETLLPPIRQSSYINLATTRLYTYAASTSSATPSSMILKRNTSLLPILLQSTPCIGIKQKDIQKKTIQSDLEDEQEDINHTDDDDYYHLLDYNHLINRLPKPVISIVPRYGQDDYGILFEQLDHIRETMPDSNTYHDYARSV